mgnify:CR=1 FL=1
MDSRCINSDGTAKYSCTIDIHPDALYYAASTGSGNNQTAYNTLFNSDGVCGSKANFFVQVPCLIPPGQRVSRKIDGLMFGSLTVFVYLFVVIYFDYIKCIALNTFVDWDVKSITAGDYSVEFDLDIKTWERF